VSGRVRASCVVQLPVDRTPAQILKSWPNHLYSRMEHESIVLYLLGFLISGIPSLMLVKNRMSADHLHVWLLAIGGMGCNFVRGRKGRALQAIYQVGYGGRYLSLFNYFFTASLPPHHPTPPRPHTPNKQTCLQLAAYSYLRGIRSGLLSGKGEN